MAIDNLFGGSDAPRVVFLDANGNSTDTVNLDFTNNNTDLPLGCMRDEKMSKIATTKILASGVVKKKFGGFRFQANYNWQVLQETHRDVIASILNHPYHIRWYPHKDLLTIYFECVVTGGDVYNLFKVAGSDRPYHQGTIQLLGVNVLKYIPATLNTVHVTSDEAWGAFSDAEKAVVFSVTSDEAWSTFSVAEQRRCRIDVGDVNSKDGGG